MDVPGILSNVPLLRKTFELLSDDPLIQYIVIHVPSDAFTVWLASGSTEFKKCILDFNANNNAGKSVILAFHDHQRIGEEQKVARDLRQAGFIAYGSLQNACRAIRRFSQYHEGLARPTID
jgi:hypothetical protein